MIWDLSGSSDHSEIVWETFSSKEETILSSIKAASRTPEKLFVALASRWESSFPYPL